MVDHVGKFLKSTNGFSNSWQVVDDDEGAGRFVST